jgi:hypothetical protein
MWRLASLLFPLTICAVFCQPRELPLPAAVVEVKWEKGFLLTIEGDKVVVRDRQGGILLSARPVPDGVPLRKLEVRDVTVAGERQIAASVYASLPLGQQANLVVFFDLDHLGKPSGVMDTGAVACRQIAGAGAEHIWCLGPDNARKVKGLDYHLIRVFDRRGAASAEFLKLTPQARKEDSPAVLLPALSGNAMVWQSNEGVLIELNAQARSPEVRRIDGIVRGRSMLSLAVLPDGRLAGLFPRRPEDSEEALATLYELRLRDEATRRWQALPNVSARPRGTVLVGAGPDGLVLWNRPARLVEWVRLPY